MIEQVLNRRNIIRAYGQVVSNKGSAGVDGMPVKALYEYLTNNRERIESALREGKYLPQAILGVEIPKSNGGERLLGIPTVVDRLLPLWSAADAHRLLEDRKVFGKIVLEVD